METKINLPHIMTDNEARYVGLIAAVVNFSDPGSRLQTHPNLNGDGFSISIDPATPEFRQELINSLLGMHRALKLKIVFSKSLAISKHVSFKINFVDNK